MPPIVSVTLPFFGLVLCGYLAARQGALPASAIPGLNAFVLFFALPCMLFRFGQQLPPERLFDPVLAGIYLAAALLMVALSIALTWARSPGAAGVSLRDAGFGALVAAFPNTGFMGVPLLVALIGPAAAGPAIATILIDLIITSTLCIALAEALPRERAAALVPAVGRRPHAARPLPARGRAEAAAAPAAGARARHPGPGRRRRGLGLRPDRHRARRRAAQRQQRLDARRALRRRQRPHRPHHPREHGRGLRHLHRGGGAVRAGGLTRGAGLRRALQWKSSSRW
ncbi:AEC family transporter [Piscinibacter sakaiensis]